MELIKEQIAHSIIYFVFSCLCLGSGWLILRFGKRILNLPQYVALIIISIFKGEEAAEKKKKEFIDGQNRRFMGYQYIAAGALFLLFSIILVVDLILR